MYKNFFKVAIRNLYRNKGFSFINIAGLTLGLTACLLIGLFVRDEKAFDKFIPGGEDIYRVSYQLTGNEGDSKIATTPPMFTTALKQNFPEVEKTLRVLNNSSKELFEAGDKKMYEDKGVYAEPTFFEFFPLQFKYGSPVKALDEPASIVISSTMAKKYFGDVSPVGKQLSMRKTPFHVKGVFENNPKFHLPIDYIIPLAAGLTEERLQSWDWYGFNNYIRLKKATDAFALQSKFQNYAKPFIKSEGTTYQPFFQPLHDIHLYSSDFRYDMAVRGNITYVKALTVIAVFILLIACFNFVNLSTAKSLQRAKEVGVRKTVGANRKQLMFQFIGETLLFAIISMLISVGLTFLLLPLLNQFTEKQIIFDLFTNPLIGVSLIGITAVVGIVAGFYPALVLSGFQPIKVLKGSVVSDVTPGQIPWLRHGLVVIQFSLSVLLIISAIVVIRQVNYLHNKDLGFNKEQIMFFPMRGENMQQNYETFKNELAASPHISSVSIGYGFPGDMFGDGLMTVAGKADQTPVKATQLMVDHDYIKTLGLQLLAGRDFAKENKTDIDESFIINETAVKDLGFGTPEQALGKTLLWPTWPNIDSFKKAQVIGVVKDFHFKSLYDKVEPAVLQIYPNAYWKVAVKMKTAGIESALAHVKKVWNRFTPDYPIEYNFLDENFDQMYKADDKLKTLLWVFTAITIFVTCLGLFGLITYAAERRKKEIGIRKVLGASVNGIALLLSKDFIKLVLLSLIIASPIAWYVMGGWLQDFAYRINMGWDIFVTAAIVALLLAIITISFQAIKSAVANPVKNLRTE